MKKYLVWSPVAAMCLVIFLFSRDRMSDAHSNHLLFMLLSAFHAATARHLAEFAYPFRKLAHIVVYSTLSLITYRALRGSRPAGYYPEGALRSVVFCLLYAGSDEIHQIFVPGRGPAVHDVLLDGLAATVTMVLLQGWYQFRRAVPAEAEEDETEQERAPLPIASPVHRG
jgi:VanZ family protein